MHSKVLLPLLASLANAATLTSSAAALPAGPTVSLYIPDADPQPLVASILSANGPTSIMQVECVPGTDSSDCGFPAPWSYTNVGNTSFVLTVPFGPGTDSTNYMQETCSFGTTMSPSCMLVIASGGTTVTSTPDIAPVTYLPVVVTGGASLLSAGASATGSGSGTQTASVTKSGGSGTGTVSSAPGPTSAAAGRMMAVEGLGLGVAAAVVAML